MPATPYLAIDPAIVEANIAAMAATARERGLALRPHVKTHKCLPIAQRQLAAGAAGLTVATVGEAEIFAAVCDDLFIAYPLWVDDAKAARLKALRDNGICLAVGVDSIAAAEQLARTAGPIDVLIEVDCGHHRSGIQPHAAGSIAAAAAGVGLTVRGVFTFPGHGYVPGTAKDVAQQEEAALATARDAVSAAGQPVDVVSGGSTPTAPSMRGGVVTEYRPGVYVFNDAQQLALGTCTVDQLALWAVATVVSIPEPGRFVLDAGSKALGADRPAWLDTHGFLLDIPEAAIVQLSEHHAVVTYDGPVPALGERVRVVPNHVCNTVNLNAALYAGPADVWPVAARDRNF
jgi:D-serine deaminase-like pyridoxal phosphate-dependent protein